MAAFSAAMRLHGPSLFQMCIWPLLPRWALTRLRCAVVEDTVPGVTAGVAAGATVFAYLPASTLHGDGAALRRAGAHHVFTDMAELPALVG